MRTSSLNALNTQKRLCFFRSSLKKHSKTKQTSKQKNWVIRWTQWTQKPVNKWDQVRRAGWKNSGERVSIIREFLVNSCLLNYCSIITRKFNKKNSKRKKNILHVSNPAVPWYRIDFLIYIYIYIYIYVCVCVYLGSISLLIHIWLNNTNILCLPLFEPLHRFYGI